ncbi:MAG: HlyC/CorC family transporter [Deltaproteobacteria bacterium]|nr:MAG: HlyC/CorC family transporter [Deltaproteobacteria bacterium]
MSTPLLLVLLGCCVLAEGFFSGSEIAVVSADRLHLRSAADRGGRGAAVALQLLERPTWLLGTCLIGTNLSTISGSTIAALLFARVLELPEATAVFFFWPITLTFGELVPKALFQHHASVITPIVALPLRALTFVFAPALWIFEVISHALGAADDGTKPAVTREEIRLLLDASQEDGVDIRPTEQALIKRVFQFTESRVEDAMVPLIEVVAVPANTPVAHAARRMAISGLSRLPVYRDRIDQIIGLVLHQDVLAADDWHAPVQSVMRPVMFVPESKPVDELLVEMRRQRAHMAVAVDEYGGAVGIITVEDLLEEIVGEIEDESDRSRDLVRRVGEREWVASGRAEREHLEQSCGLRLPPGDFETLAGYILSVLGRVPRAGEFVNVDGFVLTVTKASDRAILEVNLRRRR